VFAADECPVRGVRLLTLPLIHDLRGDLSFAQFPDHLPFVPKRYFLVFDVSSKEIRGEHAHRSLHQVLVCVKGSCAIVVDDGENPGRSNPDPAGDGAVPASPGVGDPV
jgi:UDP-2-acetamido-3-amino-2,3-dideoxy-glucuronate N-acetyltransferase